MQCPKCHLKFKEKFARHIEFNECVVCPRCNFNISKPWQATQLRKEASEVKGSKQEATNKA